MTPIAVDLARLPHAAPDGWSSHDVATVNGNAVRFRVMADKTAPWHVHDHSDELFYVLSGVVTIDTAEGAHELPAGQLLVVPAGTRHRARVSGHATLLIVDGIRSLSPA